ncbi:hypothetical protein [Allopontixanthobacter sp.]|uniref:hypothetical protein n=1 Tax=Allopontixanthobacter sp. TaxID=2906452 RepID=UPI002AB805EB|nr:hypothetical protein [Allopontixanthobacter sp.]MDZ4307393.1 hypothetical protein [Allopontixanthobacter sp.]
MALNSIFPKAQRTPDDAAEVISLPADNARGESVQRLQIGLAGLGMIILLIGLAQVVYDRAQLSEAETVPAAAATVAPTVTAPVQSDPLAEAGVVPDLPSEPAGQTVREPAIMPEEGTAPRP